MARPGKIVCVGRNYREHARELGHEVPTSPLLFFKPTSAVIASGEPIVLPTGVGRVDFEGEIGVVIGRALQRASPAECAAAVRGIVAVNDVSARDLQKSEPQWARAKGTDTFCPLGAERTGTPDLGALTVVSRLNGEECQRATSSEMIFPIGELLAYITASITLDPGDVVSTGTPAGVRALAPGDVVEVEVEGWSIVRNPVVAAS
ncbi:MAG: fumarylacetoacetate hydrolase family protein [Gemmatimonadaceae bacterium]